ncbi:hypothetical protein [Euzebya sp.]|uniref:hypothetical protein n=1 Tax=Euzebya sp. TaxID=1971409 RepID=UPI00351942B2
MTRVKVDFNAIENDVYLSMLLTLARKPLREDQRVTLFDADGLQCQAVVDMVKGGRVRFRLDPSTFVDDPSALVNS